MELSIITPKGATIIEPKTQQRKLNSPLSMLEIRVEGAESCEVQIDKRRFVCENGVKHIPVAANPKYHSTVQIKTKDTIANLQFQAAYTKAIEDRETENLMHFQNSLKSLDSYSENKWLLSDLFASIESGRITLLSVTKPLTGYDNKSLLDKLESALSQKVKAICSSPKQGIRTDELVQDVSMVKRINTNTLNHLASHTEHWKARTLSGLIPKRLRADIIEDEINIYENLFFKMAIDDIADYTSKQILSLKRAKKQNKVAIDWEEYGMKVNDYNRSELLRKLIPGKNTSELSEENKSFDDALKRWLNISKILLSIRSSSFYRKIDGKRRIGKAVHLTNILKNDQRYKALYDIWCLVRKEKQKEQQEKQGASDDLISNVNKYYFTHSIMALLYSMRLLGIRFDPRSSFSYTDSEELEIDVEAEDDFFTYYVSVGKDDYGKSFCEIEIIEKLNVFLPLPIDWQFDNKQLEQLSDVLNISEPEKMIRFYKKPSPTEKGDLRNLVHIKQSDLRRLSKAEHDHYDKCRSVWTDFIDSLDSNKGLHELKTRKLTIVPLFYKTSSEASGINKLADELFERGDDYLCYLVANSMDDFTSIEQGEVIRRVFNYGEAFFDSDNNDWKNYHRAILPVNQTDVGSIQRLMKYISLHRTKLLMEIEEQPIHCPICGGTHISKVGNDHWKCSNAECGIEWGKTRCTKGCQEYFHWIRPEAGYEASDFECSTECEKIVLKDSMLDRFVITDFEIFSNYNELKLYPVCPKCGTRRNAP